MGSTQSTWGRQEIGGRMATRLAMVAVVLTALMVLVGASENHEWFVADLGVSSDLGEDVQADKAPLSAGMIVTLRGGSANHHCGDASGSTACRHKSPTEHQKYRVVNAGGGKIGLRRGTAAFVGKVPSFVQFEVVKTGSGKITIKVPGGGYCAGKRNGPSECSLDVSSSDAIAVVCVHNCGKEKEDTPPKAAKQAGTSKRPVKPSLFDQERKGKATRRGASSKAKKGTPSPAKEKIMKEAAKPKAKKGTLNVADPAKEKKSKIVKEAANKKARVHKRDKLKAAAVARKNKIASFLKNGTKEKKAVDKKSKQKQKTVKKKAQAAKKTVAKKKGEKKKVKGKKKKAKKAVNKKAKGKKKKAKKLKKKKAGGKKKAKKLKKKKAGGKKKGKRRGKRMQ